MSLIKKLAGETVIYGASSILSRLLNYVILTPYLTKVFVEQEYGVVSLLYTYAALLMVFLTYRMETAFFRFASKDTNLNRAFSTAALPILITTLLALAILLPFSGTIADWLSYEGHRDYIIWFVLIVGFDALAAIPFAKLRLENRPIKFAVVKTVNILVNIFFIFFFLEICPLLIRKGYDWLELIFDKNNRIAYVFIANLLGSASVFLLLLPEYFKHKLQFDGALLRQMLAYAAPLVVVGIAAIVNQLINLPMLEHLLPYGLEENRAQVGIYSACYKIAILMSLFIQAFNYAAEPFFFRNSNRGDAKAIYAQVGLAFTLVGGTVFLGITSYIDFIKYFIGENFRSGLHIVPILLLAFLSLGLYYNFSIWYKLTDKTKFGAYISVAGAVITITLNFILIPIYGYVGSAWAALVCYTFMAATAYFTGKRYYPIDYPIIKMLLYIVAAIGLYFIGSIFKQLNLEWWLNIFFNTILLLGYIFLIFFFERNNLRKWKSNEA